MRTLVLLGLLTGCSHLPVLVCPKNGGPAWHEITSEHFSLRTDVPLEEARWTILEYEETLARFIPIMDRYFPPGSVPSQTDVILFAHRADLIALGAGDYVGVMAIEGDRGRPVIVLSKDFDRVDTFQHELVHRLMHRRMRGIPAWISEGLAEYLSSARFVEGQVELGRAWEKKVDSKWALYPDEIPAPDRIVRVSSYEFHHEYWSTVYYLGTWVFVHFLASHPEWEPRLIQYIHDVAAGVPRMAAFEQRLGRTESFLEPFRAHFQLAVAHPEQLAITRFPAASTGVMSEPQKDRELGEEEIHLMWAASQREGEEQLDLIAAHVGDVPSLHLGRAQLAARRHYLDTAAQELDKAVAAGQGARHWRLRSLLVSADIAEDAAKLQRSSDEVTRLFDADDDPRTLHAVARYYARANQPSLGLPLIRRLVERVPEDPMLLDTLALLLYESGDRSGALATQEEAMARLPDGIRIPAEMIDRLRMYGGNITP